ncbi:MAG: sigma-70 family RNA polymerase sigma factor [Actinobacteria bacterium]|nr:sigma-70 family RNA polymerase sigma factor [Actinomycetota bacterium]MBV9662710.1 sigma-70 family RNA polymerase sigma factor [Actinomycetota bacterium]MBV9935184.1 sigma-70 family RNA polymerase sigma factor [Actinomycetota bacterium]
MSMRGAADDALLAGLAAGDRECTTAFVRRFQSRVFGMALSVVGDPALAEDVAQEAFVRAWRHAANYDARRAAVPTWLLAITRNLAIDTVRVRRAEPMEPDAIVALQLETTDAAPPDAAASNEDADRLRRALAELPVDQRRAVVLASIRGLTAQEISDAEAIPLGTAKTRIRAAMIKLRSSLAPIDKDGERD